MRRLWTWAARLVTVLVPPFVLKHVGGLTTKAQQYAWRERILTLLLMLTVNAALVYVLYSRDILTQACLSLFPSNVYLIPQILRSRNLFYANGNAYDTRRLNLNAVAPSANSSSLPYPPATVQLAGQDLSDWSPTFTLLGRNSNSNNNSSSGNPYSDPDIQQCFGARRALADKWLTARLQEPTVRVDQGRLVGCALPPSGLWVPCLISGEERKRLAQAKVGDAVFRRRDLQQQQQLWVVLFGKVYAMSRVFQSTGAVGDNLLPDAMMQLFSSRVTGAGRLSVDVGRDEWIAAGGSDVWVRCLDKLFYAGLVQDHPQALLSCRLTNPLLYALAGLLWVLPLLFQFIVMLVSPSAKESKKSTKDQMQGDKLRDEALPGMILSGLDIENRSLMSATIGAVVHCSNESSHELEQCWSSLQRQQQPQLTSVVFVVDGQQQGKDKTGWKTTVLSSLLTLLGYQPPMKMSVEKSEGEMEGEQVFDYVSPTGERNRLVFYSSTTTTTSSHNPNPPPSRGDTLPWIIVYKMGLGDDEQGGMPGQRGPTDSLHLLLSFITRLNSSSPHSPSTTIANSMTTTWTEWEWALKEKWGPPWTHLLWTDGRMQLTQSCLSQLGKHLERSSCSVAVARTEPLHGAWWTEGLVTSRDLKWRMESVLGGGLGVSLWTERDCFLVRLQGLEGLLVDRSVTDDQEGSASASLSDSLSSTSLPSFPSLLSRGSCSAVPLLTSAYTPRALCHRSGSDMTLSSVCKQHLLNVRSRFERITSSHVRLGLRLYALASFTHRLIQPALLMVMLLWTVDALRQVQQLPFPFQFVPWLVAQFTAQVLVVFVVGLLKFLISLAQMRLRHWSFALASVMYDLFVVRMYLYGVALLFFYAEDQLVLQPLPETKGDGMNPVRRTDQEWARLHTAQRKSTVHNSRSFNNNNNNNKNNSKLYNNTFSHHNSLVHPMQWTSRRQSVVSSMEIEEEMLPIRMVPPVSSPPVSIAPLPAHALSSSSSSSSSSSNPQPTPRDSVMEPPRRAQSMAPSDYKSAYAASITGGLRASRAARTTILSHGFTASERAEQEQQEEWVDVEKDEIRDEIQFVLEDADLNAVTRREVKEHLYIQFGEAVDIYNDFINQCIEEYTLERLALL